jgi:predicted ATPase
LLGCPDQATVMAHEALRLATELAQPYSLAIALGYVSFLHQFRGEARLAQEHAEATIARAEEQAYLQYRATGLLIRGWAVAAQGDLPAGTAAIEQSLGRCAPPGPTCAGHTFSRFWRCLWMGWPTRCSPERHRRGIGVPEESGERWWKADLYRLKGELLLAQSAANHAEAESCFRRALEVGRRQSAKGFELRAATSLARLWAEQGRRSEAHDLLAPVYGWFTEGFDTADLKGAKALLEEPA